MLASLVICTRNRSRFLARTLAALTQQRSRDFEVVLVDDGSDDDTRDIARAWRDAFPLRYIRRAHTGIAASRNAAIRAATGDILICCDDDRVPDPAYVADHLAAHDPAHGPQPRVVAGRLRGLATEWTRDAAYSTGDVVELIRRHPALAARFAEDRAELVTPEMLQGDLRATLAAFELDEPWWCAHVEPIRALWPELAGFEFPWVMGCTGNLSMPRALGDAAPALVGELVRLYKEQLRAIAVASVARAST